MSDHGPWVDLHAHPGRCFLAGYTDESPVMKQLGRPDVVGSISAAAQAGVCCVSTSTVADLVVLRPNDRGGLSTWRDFAPGEARVDHDTQLQGLASSLADTRVAATSNDIALAHADGNGSAFISCEGADFLDGELDGLQPAFDLGARMITLVHYRVNELGDIQTEEPRHGGLTAFGAEVVGEMNRLGMIIDLAHATFETTVGALEASSHPLVISHSHLAGPGADHPRLLSDDHARVVADAGGLVGAWPAGVTATTLAEYVDEICRLVELIGVDHVAIGSDLDANYRPVLTEYAQFADVATLLGERGFTAADADAVLGGNVVDLFATVCG